MPSVNPFSFADALATWMAGTVSPPLQYSGVPRSLWLGQAVEGADCDPAAYSVLTAYDGAMQPIGQTSAAVQVKTVGANDNAAWQRAAALFNTLLQNSGPRQQVALDVTFKVIAFYNLRPPAQIGRDENRRAEIVFNFDAKYVALS
jgi:hypothetical protein